MVRKVPFWRVELLTLPLFKKDYGVHFFSLDREEFVESLAEDELRGRSRYVRVEDRRSAVERLFFGFFRRRADSFNDLFDVYTEIALNLFELKENAVRLKPYVWKSYFLCEPSDVPLVWKYLDLLSLRDFWVSLVILGEEISLPEDELEKVKFTPFSSGFYTFVRNTTFYELHSHAGSFMHTKELWTRLLSAIANRQPSVFDERRKKRKEERELLKWAFTGYICKVMLTYPETESDYGSAFRELEQESEEALSYLTVQFLTDFRLEEEKLLNERWVFLRPFETEDIDRRSFLKRVLSTLFFYHI